jgi:hypothetical protein
MSRVSHPVAGVSAKGRNLMRRKSLIAWCVGVFLLLFLAVMASAQGGKKTSTKEERLSGTVHRIDKETSTIIIRKGAVQRKVVYNSETRFTIQNKADGSVDDVIVGRRVICVGKFNDKAQLLATRVEVRSR